MITLKQLRAIMSHAPMSRIELFYAPLNSAMEEYAITTPLRQAAFLSQLAHESGEFKWMHELASGAAYDNRKDLGNTKAEAIEIAKKHGTTPGRWWKGHGPIQVTGFNNHEKYSEILYGDREILLHEPTRLCEPLDGCRAAAAFFALEPGMIEAADAGDVFLVSQIVNVRPSQRGPDGRVPNGWTERKSYYMRAMRALES